MQNTKTKIISSILAGIVTVIAGTHLIDGKKSEPPTCVIKPDAIHISNHELQYNDSNALKVKVRTVCTKKQVHTTIETDMFEIIGGKEHLVMPFKTFQKTSTQGSHQFYFKQIFRECLNSRVTTYRAHFYADIEIADHTYRHVKATSNKSVPLHCSLY